MFLSKDPLVSRGKKRFVSICFGSVRLFLKKEIGLGELDA
jgi:hypothetical protein